MIIVFFFLGVNCNGKKEMPKYFPQPTKHLFGSLLPLTAQMLTAEGTCIATQYLFCFSFFKRGDKGEDERWGELV